MDWVVAVGIFGLLVPTHAFAEPVLMDCSTDGLTLIISIDLQSKIITEEMTLQLDAKLGTSRFQGTIDKVTDRNVTWTLFTKGGPEHGSLDRYTGLLTSDAAVANGVGPMRCRRMDKQF